MTTWLHEQRLEAARAEVLRVGAKSVLDLGCGDGDLFVCLATEPNLCRLLGIDICAVSLERLRVRLDEQPVMAGDIELRRASMTECDPALEGFDCAVLIETIEHIQRQADLVALVRLSLASALNEMVWCAGRDGRHRKANKRLQGSPDDRPSHAIACCTGHRLQHGSQAQTGATTTSAVVDERLLIGERGAPLRAMDAGNPSDDHFGYSQSDFSARISYQP